MHLNMAACVQTSPISVCTRAIMRGEERNREEGEMAKKNREEGEIGAKM